MEVVAAVLAAYGKGEIELEPVNKDHVGKDRQYQLPGGKWYTLSTVARFLGWVKPSDKQATSA